MRNGKGDERISWRNAVQKTIEGCGMGGCFLFNTHDL